MSYILDALRRADAERSRGAVPGLHAQNIPADGAPVARGAGPLVWLAGAGIVLVAAGVLAVAFGPWRGARAPTTEARVAPAAAPELASPPDRAPLAQGELPPAQPGGLDPGARPIEPPLGRGSPPPRDAPPAVQRLPVRDALADRAAAGRVATLEPKATATPPLAEHYGAPMTGAVTAASAPGNAVPNINQLAPDLRSQLPRLVVGGAIYSDTPSARMVILNGQVFHEGDKPAADTLLEQIRLKSAILNFRGQRYEVSF